MYIVMQKDKYFGMSSRIARWKIDSPIENWLSYKADKSEFYKRIYLLYYKLFDYKYYVGGIKMAYKYISSHCNINNLDDKNAIVRDMIYSLHRYGIFFEDYLMYDFMNNKSVDYRESFVSDKLRYHYCDILNSSDIMPMMTDKYQCYQQMKAFFKRDMVACRLESDYNDFKHFADNHPLFIFKPIDAHSGCGICKVDASKIDIKSFFEDHVKEHQFVVEEIIEQGEPLSKFHPESINSVRVTTFRLKTKVDIIAATLRVGAGQSVTDNAGSGGIFASVNPCSGEIETDALDLNGKYFETHPDTNIKFKGYQLPKWSEAIDLLNQVANSLDGAILISWDLAFSKNGWVLIEANDNGAWRVLQSNKKIGLKPKLYKCMDLYFNSSI